MNENGAEQSGILANIPFFKGLSPEQADHLAALLENESAPKGAHLFRRGDPGDTVYIVQSGQVELYIVDNYGDRIVLHIAEPGEVFGEVSFLDDGPRTANAAALEDAELLSLSREHLKVFLERHPAAAMELLAVLGRRVRRAAELMTNRASRNPNLETEVKFNIVQRGANLIAEFSGSMPFLLINFIFFAVWISINTGVLPITEPFDPYPFGFLTMAVSLEAIFLSIFVLLAQNLQAAKDRVRNDIEYDVNIKAELEVAELHAKFDILRAELFKKIQNIEQGLKSHRL